MTSQEEEVGEAGEPPSHSRVDQAVPFGILVNIDIQSTALGESQITLWHSDGESATYACTHAHAHIQCKQYTQHKKVTGAGDALGIYPSETWNSNCNREESYWAGWVRYIHNSMLHQTPVTNVHWLHFITVSSSSAFQGLAIHSLTTASHHTAGAHLDVFSKGVEASRLGHHCMNGLNFLKRVSMQDNMRLFLLQCHSRSKRLHLARVAHLGRSVTFVQEERPANLCLFIYCTWTCHTVCVVYMYICTQVQKHITKII